MLDVFHIIFISPNGSPLLVIVLPKARLQQIVLSCPHATFPRSSDQLVAFAYCIIIIVYSSSASNRLIHAKDHASVQLVIADVDPATGRATESAKMYVVCGAIRRMGESDDCIVRLTKKDGILTK